MSEVMISMKGIAKSYGKHRVLEDIDLEINKGDIWNRRQERSRQDDNVQDSIGTV